MKTVCRKSRLQILDPEGNVDKDIEPALENETLEKFYRTMVLTRLFDEKALKLQRQGRMLTYGSCLGQEASQIEMAAFLEDLAGTIHPHPTLSEDLAEAAEAALGKVVHI